MATNQTFDLENFKARLKTFDALRDSDKIRTDSLPHIQPQYADEWPAELEPSVREALNNTGIDQLFQHQAEAISKSLSGTDVVLESPTASGKTLAFTVPMLDTLVRDRGAHALMIYPMKALAYDQGIQIEQLCKPLSIKIATFDGDTSKKRRPQLKQNPPPILLTNPENLNMAFLGWRNQWEKFLPNLKYVVVDEMHEYRGFFGGNMALLLRRFFLYLNSIGANPRIFLSSATCANPEEHAKNLTGRDIEVVPAGNVLRPTRHFLFINPKVPDYLHREIVRVRVEQAALTVLAEGLQALVFCPTKRFLEEALEKCWSKAKEKKLDPDRISAFHADMNATKKREIQQKIKDGSINVVFTTNALELGIDIGGLDGVILAGFPRNIMSAWQQIGRAGRGWNKEAFVLFYAMNDPIDQFFVGNLDAFLNKSFDELVVDPSNEELIEAHIPMLKAETNGNLSASAKNILGSTFYDAAKNNSGRLPKYVRPHPLLKIRGDLGQSYKLKCDDDDEIGKISHMRRFREAYIGAVFTFFGQKYIVHAHEKDAVVLIEAEQHLKTEASFFTKLESLMPFDGVAYGEIEMFYGALDLSMRFTGYKVVDERSGEELEAHPTGDAYTFDNRHAFWVSVPPSECATEGIGALEHIIRVGAMFVIPADRFDTSTYSKTGDEPFASYYENYSSGIGIAKKLFTILPEVLEKGIEIAENCGCQSGCPNCIQPAKSYDISNTEINKIRGIELAMDLLAAMKGKPDQEFRNGQLYPV